MSPIVPENKRYQSNCIKCPDEQTFNHDNLNTTN